MGILLACCLLLLSLSCEKEEIFAAEQYGLDGTWRAISITGTADRLLTDTLSVNPFIRRAEARLVDTALDFTMTFSGSTLIADGSYTLATESYNESFRPPNPSPVLTTRSTGNYLEAYSQLSQEYGLGPDTLSVAINVFLPRYPSDYFFIGPCGPARIAYRVSGDVLTLYDEVDETTVYESGTMVGVTYRIASVWQRED